MVCPTCGGTGRVETIPGHFLPCGQCDGAGMLPSALTSQEKAKPSETNNLITQVGVVIIIGIYCAIGLAILLGVLYGVVWILHAMWRAT